jgi:hypothetical protein
VPIQLQFVSENYLSSRIIGWFGGGNLSHVDAIWGGGADLLGARSDDPGGFGKGVRIRASGYVKFSRRVVMTLVTTPAQDLVWQQFLNSQIGKPYDWRAIMAFIFGRNWRETDSWICSELQAAALEAAQIVPKLYLSANKITPDALALMVSALPGVTVETFAA